MYGLWQIFFSREVLGRQEGAKLRKQNTQTAGVERMKVITVVPARGFLPSFCGSTGPRHRYNHRKVTPDHSGHSSTYPAEAVN